MKGFERDVPATSDSRSVEALLFEFAGIVNYGTGLPKYGGEK